MLVEPKIVKKILIRTFLFTASLFVAFSAEANLTTSVTLEAGSPSAIYPTQETRLSITLANSGGVDLTGVNFDVSLPGTWPAGLQISGVSTYACTNSTGAVSVSGTLTAATGSSRIALSAGLIPARSNNIDGQCTIVVPVTVGNSDNSSYTFTIASGAVAGLENGAPVSNSGSVSQSVNVSQLAGYTVQESYSTSSVYQGDEVTLTVTVTNPNPVPIPNVLLTHAFNAAGHIQVASSPLATSSCNNSGGSTSFSPLAGAGSLGISGTVPAKSGVTNGICTFSVKIKAVGVNNASTVNTANTISGGGNDVNAGVTKYPATLTIGSALMLSEVLGHNGTYYAGDWKTLTITLQNRSSTQDLSSVGFDLTDHIRKGTVTSATVARGLEFRNISTTCGGGASINGTTLSLSGASLGHNSSCTVSADYKLYTDLNSYSTATFYGVLPVNLVSNSSNFYSPSNYTTTNSLTVVSAPSVTQQWQGASSVGSTATVTQGETKTLTITLSNPTQTPINITSFTKDPIDGLTNSPHPSYGLNVTSGTTTCSGGSVVPSLGGYGFTLTGGIIPNNGSCTVTLNFVGTPQTGLSSTSYSNSISTGALVVSDGLLVSGSSSSGNLTVRSPLQASIAYALTSNPSGTISTLSAGASGRLKLTLTNGSSTENISAIQLLLDPLLRYSSSSGNAATGLNVTSVDAGTCSSAQVGLSGSTGFSLSGLSLSAGQSCTVYVDFNATPVSGYTSSSYSTYILGTGTVGSTGVLSGQLNGTTILSSGVSGAIMVVDVLRISKSQVPGYYTSYPYGVVPGGPVKYTINIDNYDDTTTQNNVRVLDSLPNGVKYLTGTINGHNFSPTVSGSNCGTVSSTNVLGDVALQFNLASIPQASSGSYARCSLTFWGQIPTTATVTTYNSAFNNTIPIGGVCSDNGAGNCNGGATSSSSARVSAPIAASFSYFNYAYSTSSYSSSPWSGSFYYGYTGSPTRFRINLFNYTPNALTGVTASGALPSSSGSQLQIAYPYNFSTTCGSTPDQPISGGTSFSFSGLTVPARGEDGIANSYASCYVEFDITGSAGSYSPSVLVSGATGAHADGTAVTYADVNSTGSEYRFFAALSGSLAFSPSSLVTGRQASATVTMTASASGDALLNGVAFNHTLPTGVVLAPVPNARATCDGVISITASPGASSVQMSGAKIARGTSCQLLYDVVVNFPGNVGTTITDTVSAGQLTAESGQVVANIFSANLTRALANTDNMLVSLTANPSTLTFPGQVSRLQVTLRSGTTNLTKVRSNLYLTSDGLSTGSSTGVVIAPNSQASTTCTGGVLNAVAGSNLLALSEASIPANSECTIAVNVLSVLVGGKTITAPSNSILTNEGATNLNTATTSLAVGSNIGVVKEFTPRVVSVNQRSRLKITFYNPTALPMSSLAVTDTLPSGLVVPPGASPTTSCAGASVSAPTSGSVVISGGTISATPSGASSVTSCYAEIDVVSANEGSFTNTIPVAGVSAVVAGAVAANSQPASDTLLVKSPLEVHIGLLYSGSIYKTNDSGTLPTNWQSGVVSKLPGTTATLKIKLTNGNTSSLSNLGFNLPLPTGVTLSSSPSASSTCGGSLDVVNYGTYIRLFGGALASASSCEITANVVSGVIGSSNRVVFSTALVNTYEGVTNAEPSSTTLEVLQSPTVGVEFSPSVIPPNGVSSLIINIGNPNSTAISLSGNFVNTLPAGVVIANTPNKVSTCTGTVTATAASSTVTFSSSSSSVPAGGCVISVDVTGASLGSYVNYIASEQINTSSGRNLEPASATLKISTLGYVAGRVFKDNNTTPNGVFDISTDDAIYGATVSLYAGSVCSGSAVSSTTTNELGVYSFTGLSAGTYSVCQTGQPSGTINGTTSAGTINSVNGSTGASGIASNSSSTTSQIVGIILNGDGSSGAVSGSDGNNFAEVVPSSISGTVFSDINNNGVQNGSDIGLSNVTINISDAGNTVVATTTTNALGFYEFTGLEPGTYYIEQPTQPTGTANGQTILGAVPNGGSSGTATATNVLPSRIGAITLPPNTSATGFNFAEIPNNRTIYGWVFLDRNADGSRNGSDTGLAGQTINLSGTDANGNSVSRTTATASDGSYAFTGLSEGSAYTLTQPNQPASTANGITSAGSTGGTATAQGVTPSAISGINLSGLNTVSAENNFAELPVASPDLTVTVTKSPTDFNVGSQAGTYVITPNNNGDNPTNGTITLTFTTPTGMTPTSASGTGWSCGIASSVVTCTSTSVINAGTSGNAVTVIVSVDISEHGHVLTSVAAISGGGEPSSYNGNNSSSLSVSVLGTGSLRGTVWRDVNKNRVLDSGEPLLQGWYVKLYRDGALVDTVQTDVNGVYQFTGAIPGNYQIRFSSSAGETVYGRPVLNEGGLASSDNVRDANANPLGASTADGTIRLGLTQGDNASGFGMPVPTDPSGVVYDAITRNPVSGVQVTISGPSGFTSAHVVGGSLTQTTGSDGAYQFWLLSNAPAGTYTLSITSYPSGYNQSSSSRIPVCSNALIVGASPNPALVQQSSTAPVTGATLHDPATCPTSSSNLSGTSTSTQYYSSFDITPGTSADVLNNHIPIDPSIPVNLIYKKTVDKSSALVTDTSLVYTVVIGNSSSVVSGTTVHVYDQLPAGVSATAVAGVTNIASGGVSCTNMNTAGALLDCTVTLTSAIPANTALTSSGASSFTITTTVPSTPGTITNFVQMSTTGAVVATPDPATASCTSPSICSAQTTVSAGDATLTLDKKASAKNVELGDSVLYTITLRHVGGGTQSGVVVTDNLPLGFKYIPNTVKVVRTGSSTASSSGDTAVGISGVGPTLIFNIGAISNGDVDTITYRVRVGVGSQQGNGVNRATARSASGVTSNEARATVNVESGIFAQEGCIVGKVYLDCNGNGIQDRDDGDEPGVGGVRLYMEDGAYMVSDPRGAYSICGVSAMTHVLKLDKTTLPTSAKLGISANRNAKDPDSIFVDMKFGELHRADFIVTNCSADIKSEVVERSKGASSPTKKKSVTKTKIFSSKEQKDGVRSGEELK